MPVSGFSSAEPLPEPIAEPVAEPCHVPMFLPVIALPIAAEPPIALLAPGDAFISGISFCLQPTSDAAAMHHASFMDASCHCGHIDCTTGFGGSMARRARRKSGTERTRDEQRDEPTPRFAGGP